MSPYVDFRTALVQLCNDRAGLKGLVRCPAMVCLQTMRAGDQSAEFDVLGQRRNANRIEALAGQQNEAPRLPKASVSARISVVIPPFDLPMA